MDVKELIGTLKIEPSAISGITGSLSHFRDWNNGKLLFATLTSGGASIEIGFGKEFPLHRRPYNECYAVVGGRLDIRDKGSITLWVDSFEVIGASDLDGMRNNAQDVANMLQVFVKSRKEPKQIRSVALIAGRGATEGKRDFMKNMSKYIKVQDLDIPVSGDEAPQAIASKMAEIDSANYDLICVVRGGGTPLEIDSVFSNPAVVEAAGKLKTPLLIGIGHESNHPVIEQVSNYVASVPHEAGVMVKRMNQELYRNFAQGRSARKNVDFLKVILILFGFFMFLFMALLLNGK